MVEQRPSINTSKRCTQEWKCMRAWEGRKLENPVMSPVSCTLLLLLLETTGRLVLLQVGGRVPAISSSYMLILIPLERLFLALFSYLTMNRRTSYLCRGSEH